MSKLPTNFIADLRYPMATPDLDESKWSQWRTVHMIELSALDTYQFVKSMLTQPAQKILEIGSGNGYLSLELARDGHDVIGIDLSPDIIEVAERTKAAHPDTPGFGRLRYLCADVGAWPALDASFDAVIFNRSLHHLSELQQRKCLRHFGVSFTSTFLPGSPIFSYISATGFAISHQSKNGRYSFFSSVWNNI